VKNGKRPTRAQKQAIKDMGLVVENWLVFKTDTQLNRLYITHRKTGTVKVIPA